MNVKKILCVITLIAVLISSIGVQSLAEEITIRLDDVKVDCPVPARIENGRTMVPMRAIFEAFGMNVTWNNELRSVTATKNDDTIIMTVGEAVLVKNGKETALDVAPYIAENTTLIPVRAVAEALNATVEWNDEKRRVEITTSEYEENKDKWKENEGEINLSDMTVTGEGVAVEGNTVVITKGGDFSVIGENENAMIHVNATEKVKLRLSSVKLKNPSGPAIFFENSKESLITITKGTENFVEDGSEYNVDAKAAVFSNDDIEIKGEGTLTVLSHAYHAIASDDDIKIEEGTLILTSDAKDGIHANNQIKIKGGNITVTAKGDGIQAEENVVIEGGEIFVTTTGEVINVRNNRWMEGGFGGKGNRNQRVQKEPNTSNEGNAKPMGTMEPMEMPSMPEGMREMGQRGWMAQNNGNMTPPEGMENMLPPGGMRDFAPPEGMENMLPPEGIGAFGENSEQITEDEAVATKGIKAQTDVTITGGKINVDAADHAIHSAGTITISGGELTLSSKAGKGISAHGEFVINDGKITVTKASEGLESKSNLTINGGEISVTGSDDGINAGGTSGRDVANRNNAENSTGHDLFISGGTIFVNASGDGLDANGRMIISGGNIIVEGPTNNGNGSLDSGGVIRVNGGTLIALGASGMAETPGSDSKQPAFRLITNENIAPDSVITIINAQGEEIYSYTTVKTGNSVIFSSDKLKVGETYTVKIGETEYKIEMTSKVTSSGNGGFGGFGGRRW